MIGEPRADSGRELNRIVSISDGVFAIVITLLILDIQVPSIPQDRVAEELAGQLQNLGPKFFSYAISFLVVALYWTVHHRVFQPIQGYDRVLLWLNFLFLMSVSFLPFPTSLLGEYGEQQLSVIIYAASAAVSSLLLVAISWYAARGGLVDPGHDHEAGRRGRTRGMMVPAIFLASIGISFFSVTAATYSWLLLFVVDPVVQRVLSR